MFLKLTNFKFHRDYSIIIPEEGMTLLCGPSGIGKTAILNSISFGLYGKIKRPYSHTTKTCSVELKSEKYKIHIIRSKNPNKLSVTYNNKKYEEKSVAQAVIDSVFKMDHSKFAISSFFDHKKINSLISMSPSEQLNFVEKLALSNSEKSTNNKTSSAEDIKNIINTHKIILEKEYNSLNKKIEFITLKLNEKQDILNNLTKTLKEHSNSIEKNTNISQTLDEYKKEYELIGVQIEQTNEQIRLRRKEIVALQSKEKDEKKIEIERIKIETTLNGYLQALTELPNNITDKELNELNLVKDTLQNMCYMEEKYIRDREQVDWKIKKLNTDIKRIESEILTTQELHGYELTISNYENISKLISYSKDVTPESLKKDYEFIKEIVSTTSHIQKNIIVGNTVSSLVRCIEEEIVGTDKILRRLESLSSKKILKCPKCSSELTENDSDSVKNSGSVELLCVISKKEKEKLFDPNTRKSIQENIACAESKIDMLLSQLETCKKCLILDTITTTTSSNYDLNDDFVAQNSTSPQEMIIKNKLIVNNDKIKKDELIRLKNELSTIIKEKVDIPKNPKCLADVKTELNTLENTIKDAFHSRGERSRLNRNIEVCKKSLSKFKVGVLTDLNRAEEKVGDLCASDKINKITKDIEPLEVLLDQLNKKIIILKKSEDYVRTSTSIKTIKEEIFSLTKDKEELSAKLINIESRIKGSIGLELSEKETELFRIVNILNNINIRANEYLSDLFDNHIDVRLKIKKETKSGKISAKPSIELAVIYRGNVYDDIDDEISGGERQRIDLAFLFAVNDIIGSNILLLDECFNNLHPEVNTQILSYISNSQLFEGKQIVIISHEAIHGVFNKVIHLSEIIEV